MSPCSVTRRLITLACACLLSALVTFAVLLAINVSGYNWPAGTEVPRDGQSHVVRLAPGRSLVWIHQVDGGPTCLVEDLADHQRITLHWVSDPHVRIGGSAGDHVGEWSFQAPGDVLVSCDGPRDGRATPIAVHVEGEPGILGIAFGRGGTLAAGLAAAGVAAGLSAALAAEVSSRRRAGSRAGAAAQS